MDILGQTDSRIWRSTRGALDPGTGSGGPRRKSHGARLHGRSFRDFLCAALYKAGFANQPTSVRRDDGLRLKNAYIVATIRCAPPANKPLPSEIANCRGYLVRELEILQPKAVLALGKIGWDAYLDILKARGAIASKAAYLFAHGAEAELPGGGPRLFGVYHPSQQNTQTGRVTPAMYSQVLRRIRRFLEK